MEERNRERKRARGGEREGSQRWRRVAGWGHGKRGGGTWKRRARGAGTEEEREEGLERGLKRW